MKNTPARLLISSSAVILLRGVFHAEAAALVAPQSGLPLLIQISFLGRRRELKELAGYMGIAEIGTRLYRLNHLPIGFP